MVTATQELDRAVGFNSEGFKTGSLVGLFHPSFACVSGV